MNKEELRVKIADLEQYIFKLKSDFRLIESEQCGADLCFLKDLRVQIHKWNDSNDWAARDYAFTMVNDWINELEQKLNKP